MIIHETVGIGFTVTFSGVSNEGIEKSLVIIIRRKDVLLIDASGDDVVNSGTAFNAGHPWHKNSSQNKIITENILQCQTKAVKQRPVRLCENSPFSCLRVHNMV